MRDELGVNEMNQANPIQAAAASGAAFTFGALLPLLVSMFLPLAHMVYYQYTFAILFLAALGAMAAKAGGSGFMKAMIRITFWGTAVMGLTALVGYLFGINM